MSTSKDLESKECNPFSTSKFLKDVFMCSLVAFGGPEAHLGVFLDRMVQKKKYLSEKALLEWMALCSFLPGPTSTQVIATIGLEKGGRMLALLTLIIWAFPAICVMSLIAPLLSMWLNDYNFLSFTGFLAPMATAFVLAAWVLGKKVITNFINILFYGLLVSLSHYFRQHLGLYLLHLLLVVYYLLHFQSKLMIKISVRKKIFYSMGNVNYLFRITCFLNFCHSSFWKFSNSNL